MEFDEAYDVPEITTEAILADMELKQFCATDIVVFYDPVDNRHFYVIGDGEVELSHSIIADIKLRKFNVTYITGRRS